MSDLSSICARGTNHQDKLFSNEALVLFDALMEEAIGKITQVTADAGKAVDEITAGMNFTEAIMAIEKAGLTFRLMDEVRHKLIYAYQKIMNVEN